MFQARTLLIAALAAVGLLVSPALAANAPGSETPIIDTHVPEPNEPVQYESSLAPGVATSGSITAMDRFEWYCFKVNSGVAIAITVTTTSGGLQPNCGLFQGVVNDGVQAVNLGPILAATNSLSPTSVTLNYTPTFTGPVTLWVAGALSSIGDYNVTMTGGEQRSGCSPCPTCVVATAAARRRGAVQGRNTRPSRPPTSSTCPCSSIRTKASPSPRCGSNTTAVA